MAPQAARSRRHGRSIGDPCRWSRHDWRDRLESECGSCGKFRRFDDDQDVVGGFKLDHNDHGGPRGCAATELDDDHPRAARPTRR